MAALADAYFRLLFGKDSTGAAVFDVKTVGTSGLDYGVTAEIEIDGKKHILSRTLNEKWEGKHDNEVDRKSRVCSECENFYRI